MLSRTGPIKQDLPSAVFAVSKVLPCVETLAAVSTAAMLQGGHAKINQLQLEAP